MNNFGFSQCGVLEIVGRDPDSRGFVFKPGSKLVSAVQALHAARYYPLTSPRYEFIALVVPRSGCSLNSHISLPYSISFFSMSFGKSCPLSTTIPIFSAGSLAQPCEPILKILTEATHHIRAPMVAYVPPPPIYRLCVFIVSGQEARRE